MWHSTLPRVYVFDKRAAGYLPSMYVRHTTDPKMANVRLLERATGLYLITTVDIPVEHELLLLEIQQSVPKSK